MKMEKHIDGNTLTICVEGRIDLNTAPELEKEIEISANIERLVFDFEKLEYISSAGLRLILSLHDTMSKQGSMTIKNMNKSVREVFDITGLSEELNIE